MYKIYYSIIIITLNIIFYPFLGKKSFDYQIYTTPISKNVEYNQSLNNYKNNSDSLVLSPEYKHNKADSLNFSDTIPEINFRVMAGVKNY